MEISNDTYHEIELVSVRKKSLKSFLKIHASNQLPRKYVISFDNLFFREMTIESKKNKKIKTARKTDEKNLTRLKRKLLHAVT